MSVMMDFFEKLFATDFMPHIYCIRRPEVIWLDEVSDLVIALSYFLIPLALIYMIRIRRDLVYPWMFWLFGVFILSCGTTHILAFYVLRHPVYRLEAMVKAVTAISSFPTAILLMRLVPKVRLLPSAEQLRVQNVALANEVAQRKGAEAEIRRLNENLEQRVAERTSALEESNAALRKANLELIKAEEALRAGEEEFRTLANAIPQLCWMARADGHIFWYNQRWYDYTGTTFDQMQGWGWQRLHDPQILPAVMERWNHALRSGEPFEMVFPLRGADGVFRPFLTRIVPLRDSLGRIARWFGTNTDISEQKRVESELRRANHDLEQFAFSASHDLQEPLRNVAVFSELIGKRYAANLDTQGAEFLGYVMQGARRMSDLITGLLAYTQAGNTQITADLTDANAVLATVLSDLETTIAATRAVIDHDPLPTISIVPAHLRQLFQNLIGNALKYRQPGEPPRVRMSAARVDHNWQFAVNDNGIGIDPNYQEQIFGVFKRLHTTDEYAGTGIGLAICQKIVERYGGRIWVESEVGKGSTFFFTLPA